MTAATDPHTASSSPPDISPTIKTIEERPSSSLQNERMPLFPENTGTLVDRTRAKDEEEAPASRPQQDGQPEHRPPPVQIKNRRKRYLDSHPEYFGSDLELADPLLYDRLIRRFQTTEERESEGRNKGHTGVLEADLMRSELKMEALAHPDPHAMFNYTRGPSGEILAEDQDEIPSTKEEGAERWRWEMEMRFLKGADTEFDYTLVDECDDYDDWSEEQEKYFEAEEPEWLVEEDDNGNMRTNLQGETGVQDF